MLVAVNVVGFQVTGSHPLELRVQFDFQLPPVDTILEKPARQRGPGMEVARGIDQRGDPVGVGHGGAQGDIEMQADSESGMRFCLTNSIVRGRCVDQQCGAGNCTAAKRVQYRVIDAGSKPEVIGIDNERFQNTLLTSLLAYT